MQLATLQALARYWAAEYDWRRCEAKLNALPQFTTEIDGLDVHFIHVKSPHENALPLIITHGWPGSVIEMLEVIGPLTDPTAYGGDAADAFDVVVPSMPGYGFSGQPTEVGWDAGRIASAWAELMGRLGYSRYVAQGGDQGAGVTDALGRLAPDGLLGLHFNFLSAAPRELLMAALNIRLAFSMEDREELSKVVAVFMRGYIAEMGEHPQTIGYPLVDSPLGLAAWMLDHDADAYEKISHAFVDGQPSGNLTRDHVLDDITLYWLMIPRHRRRGCTGRTTPTTSNVKIKEPNNDGNGASRSRSRCSPARSTRHRGAGPSAPTPTSRTTTGSTRAATSPPGRSRSCSPKSCGRRSDHCGSRARWGGASPCAVPATQGRQPATGSKRPSWWEPRSPTAPRVEGSGRTVLACPTPSRKHSNQLGS